VGAGIGRFDAASVDSGFSTGAEEVGAGAVRDGALSGESAEVVGEVEGFGDAGGIAGGLGPVLAEWGGLAFPCPCRLLLRRSACCFLTMAWRAGHNSSGIPKPRQSWC
jgi:hypothetical protein